MARAYNTKKTLTDFLVENFFSTVSEAQEAIKLGIVNFNGKVAKRGGITIDEESDSIKVIGDSKLFVGRGGYKLQKALKHFCVNLQNKICLDIGASTGGFTDCMIQYNAQEVYAIDTGYGQLAWKLRTNPKVHCVERMNVRYLLPERLYPDPEMPKAVFAAIDVSFISAIKVLPSVQSLLAGPDHSEFVILIKPQFEAGKSQVAKGGLIKNPSIHLDILYEFVSGAHRTGVEIKKIIHSPLLGASGNLEFLAFGTWPKAGPHSNPVLKEWLKKIIDIAYTEFNLF